MISGKLRLINSLNWKQNLATIPIRLIADFSDDHDHYNLITNDGCFLGKETYNNLIVTNRGILYENIRIRSWASRPSHDYFDHELLIEEDWQNLLLMFFSWDIYLFILMFFNDSWKWLGSNNWNEQQRESRFSSI